MRVRRSLLFTLLAGILSFGLTFALHGCQASQEATLPTVAQSPVAASVRPAPSPTPLPPETQAIVATAGPKGLFQPPRGDMRLVVISDLNSAYGSVTYDPEVDKAMQLLPFWQPDIVLCSGDMIAGQDPSLSEAELKAMWAAFDQHVAAPIRKLNVPYGFTVGNHDASGAVGATGQFLFQRDRTAATTYWNDPAHSAGLQFVDKFEFPFYYTFELNGIFFVAWDGSTSSIPADKLAWVEKALASETAQNAKMRVLIGHLPLYSVAVGRDQAGDVMDNPEKLRALLEQYKVHTYISGHHHAYYPAHRGKLQLLHMGLLGSGPRPIIDSSQAPRKSLTVIDVKFDDPELTTYTTYDMQTLQLIPYEELPRSITGVNGMIVRRDVNWADLTAAERATCENQFGRDRCQA